MLNKKQIEKDIKLMGSFKGLAEAYEEISVSEMQKARGKVLSTRLFLQDLSTVFANVKGNYSNEIEKLLDSKKKGIFSLSTQNKNGKSISVLLTSNNRLYGDIGRKVYKYFIEDIQKSNPDIYIIGKIGREFYENMQAKKDFKYIDFPDTDTAKENFSEVLKYLQDYQNVNVYYGQFVNVITQNPTKANVTGTAALESGEGKEEKLVKFFFEPSLESVLAIFETQIFRSLLRQTLHESELSHVTSRIQQMENALSNIEITTQQLTKKRRIVLKRLESARWLQRLSGIRLWR